MCSGRTGRAGRSGTAITFFVDEDAVNLRRLVFFIMLLYFRSDRGGGVGVCSSTQYPDRLVTYISQRISLNSTDP